MRYIAAFDGASIDVTTANAGVMKNLLAESTTMGTKTIFNIEQEKALISYILQASDINYGIGLMELRKLAYEFARKVGASYPDPLNDNQQASKDWQLAFMKRQKNLSLRTPEQVSQSRAKRFNKENVDAFFANLSSVLGKTPFEPHRIWNMDETGCPTVETRPVKTIARKGQKQVGSSTSAEKGTNVSLALAVSASGQSIPPFFLFPRVKMKEIFMTHASHGAVGVANGYGYMNSDVFPQFMRHFIKHTVANADSPTMLLLDNHGSHLSIEAIDLALHHGITLLSFPPKCTHKMQPLDVASNIGVTFDLHHVPILVDQCLDVMLTPKTIKSDFRTTGIYPFNPQIFTEVDFVASELSGENLFGDEEKDADNQRRVSTSEASTSAPASTSGAASSSLSLVSAPQLRDALKSVGPLKLGTPAPKSKRGRKTMESTVLTSPEVVADLRDKAEKKRQKLTKAADEPAAKKQKGLGKSKTPWKRSPSPTETDIEEDFDFCTICKKKMPKHENRQNTAHL
ncbi:uncharacterized protein LOC125777870 [Bactrocera dorsalis]|uniref:Uncharacterized protein LOC125777870 n=1 Tax=Bactrocera dorsalis TaxID=27457 RepID=A0ABM3JKZ9_BACDO|nr:uncharacterized protein LOC125777870 [Bactrocera dorsalis]